MGQCNWKGLRWAACWMSLLVMGGACSGDNESTDKSKWRIPVPKRWRELYTLSDSAREVKVTVRGKGERRPMELVMKGELTSSFKDPEYQYVPDMAMLSCLVAADGLLAPNKQQLYGKDTLGDSTPTWAYKELWDTLRRKKWQAFVFNKELKPDQSIIPVPDVMEGLTYDVWVKPDSKLAVLVFRGTDFAELADWWTNMHPFLNTPGKWDQYEQVRALTPKVVDTLRATYGQDLRIFTAGHSLGGGLAQHAAYTCKDVEKVFTFNSSPVTGYLDLSEQERQDLLRRKPRTFMVYESFEVLSGFRMGPNVLRRLANNLDVVTVRYNFSRKGNMPFSDPVRQHKIKKLVFGLTGIEVK